MFSERLKALRNELGFTQTQIANQLNVTQQTYAKWESGKGKPRATTLEKLASLLKVSTDYLLGNTDIKNPEETISDVDMLFRRTSKDLTPEQQEVFKQELMDFMEMRRKAFEEDNK